MDLMQYPRQEYSISHFARPCCLELRGSRLTLVMDSGVDVTLSVMGETVRMTSPAETVEASYYCVKGDDTTYLLTFDNGPKENHVFILDRSQRLVTHLLCVKGRNPRDDQMTSWEFDFGAIREEGYRLPYKRHSFTSEHLGTTVQWRWSPTMYTKHAYLESAWYRITWDDDGDAAGEFDNTNEKLPSDDEHARYIKIKDNLIFFTLTEAVVERLLGDKQVFRCNNLSLLQNYDRMIQVGRGFGDLMTPDGGMRHIFVPLCAYGSPVELPERFLNAPNPYTV